MKPPHLFIFTDMDTKSIHFKSDFLLRLSNEVDWSTPFIIRFFTTRAVSAKVVAFDGENYVGCTLDESTGALLVPFERFTELYRQGLGTLRMELTYRLSNALYPDQYQDVVLPAQPVVCTNDQQEEFYLSLGLTGDDDVEVSASVVAPFMVGPQGTAGTGIASMAQTSASMASAGANVWKMTLTDGREFTFTVLNGEKGDTGAQGPQGPQGAKGAKGDKGDKGDTGARGPQGEQGPRGIPGPRGEKGAKGDTGARGLKGETGPAGNTPQIGQNGNWWIGGTDTGVKADYSGTEAQRQEAFEANEAERQEEFDSKEATRDAANQAALNCAETLSALGQQLDGVKDRVTATETAIRDLQELFGESVEGYVRVAETSDPKMEFREYKHTKVGEESVFDCYKPCLVGNNFTGEGTCGKILHILNPLDWYKDENGNAVVLDGSMGEVLICNTETLYAIVGHVSVDNVDYDVFLYSRIPFEWNGHRAEELPSTGLSPHYCVSHTDSDNVTRMHSVLNMEWDGSYQAQVDCVGKFVATDDGEGNIVETYDADAKIIGDAKGKSSTGISLSNGEQYAMNINDDNTKTIPYFNSHVDAVEKHHVGLMFAESGTFYLHAATKMGSGFCANVQATTAARWAEDNSEASNGFRYIKHDGTTWGYYPLSSNANFGLGTTGDSLYKACMLNLWRSPWNIFEQQRVLMYAVANHIEELTWFAFEGNIYKYRSVDGLKGLADGVMTGVVWKKLASKLKDGAVEPSTENAVGGNRCEWLISSAVYRGVITDVSPSWWTSGLWMTQWGTDNRYEGWLCRDQSKMLKSSNSNTIDDSTLLPQEQSDDYIKLPTLTYGTGYRKNYAQTLFWSDRIASMSGAGIGTHIGAYAYLNGTRPAEGKKVARGCRRGAVANYTYLSPLCVIGSYAPSNAYPNLAFGICCRIES